MPISNFGLGGLGSLPNLSDTSAFMQPPGLSLGGGQPQMPTGFSANPVMPGTQLGQIPPMTKMQAGGMVPPNGIDLAGNMPQLNPIQPPQVMPPQLSSVAAASHLRQQMPDQTIPVNPNGGMSAARFAAILNGAQSILGAAGQGQQQFQPPRPPTPNFNVGARPMVQPLMAPFFAGRG